MPASITDRIAEIYAKESRRVLATLIRLLGDIDQAEDALQEAFGAALVAWPKEGLPRNPWAWLVSAGKFRGIDAIRRRRRGNELILREAGDSERGSSVPGGWTGGGVDGGGVERGGSDGNVVKDDQLRLIFICCHPALPIDARIVLSLRTVRGLTTREIAHSFLVPVETLKKRISRAKATIREKQIPYEVPPQPELAERLDAVLHVVYLVYNEGYSASSGSEHLRRDLAKEAVFLSRLLVELLPEPEATGLLALLLLHESRSAARTDTGGDLVPLEDQDRALWDRDLIAEGLDLVRKSMMSGRMGSYVIQAAIASVHAAADSVASTNWDLIVEYYDRLLLLQDAPVVALHRAIAIGMRDGPAEALLILDDLLETRAMSSSHRTHAVRADFARRAGSLNQARDSYRRALELVQQEPERRYLERRLAQISD